MSVPRQLASNIEYEILKNQENLILRQISFNFNNNIATSNLTKNLVLGYDFRSGYLEFYIDRGNGEIVSYLDEDELTSYELDALAEFYLEVRESLRILRHPQPFFPLVEF